MVGCALLFPYKEHLDIHDEPLTDDDGDNSTSRRNVKADNLDRINLSKVILSYFSSIKNSF